MSHPTHWTQPPATTTRSSGGCWEREESGDERECGNTMTTPWYDLAIALTARNILGAPIDDWARPEVQAASYSAIAVDDLLAGLWPASPLRFCALVVVPYLALAGASDAVFAGLVLAAVTDAWNGELHWRKESELRHRGEDALRLTREWLAANEQREREKVAARQDEWDAWLSRRRFTATWIATWWMSERQRDTTKEQP